MNISKYRNNYEDIIMELSNNIDLAILNEVINNADLIAKNPISDSAIKIIDSTNKLKNYKETIDSAMLILDKK